MHEPKRVPDLSRLRAAHPVEPTPEPPPPEIRKAPPFKIPQGLKTPCDGPCGKRYPKEKLVVRGLYAYCEKCDPEPKPKRVRKKEAAS